MTDDAEGYMSESERIIDDATDRFYPITHGTMADARPFLWPRLVEAMRRHGITPPGDLSADCLSYTFKACMDVHRLGVTAIEIAAACALAEQDYLRSKQP